MLRITNYMIFCIHDDDKTNLAFSVYNLNVR